ncbi:MAG: hypothetical protein IIB38_08120 [Candidatus Hydrogenedentes bacterium]|nr:hypothetical protein [Candidatus Hydrogenedentota bacterium]
MKRNLDANCGNCPYAAPGPDSGLPGVYCKHGPGLRWMPASDFCWQHPDIELKSETAPDTINTDHD